MIITYLYEFNLIMCIIYAWRKHFSVTFQTFIASLITQTYLDIFDNGGGNIERDFSSTRAVEVLSALVI